MAVAALKAGAADYVVKDVHGDFLILLEKAVTNAMFATAIKRDKERAEAEVRFARGRVQGARRGACASSARGQSPGQQQSSTLASLLHFQADISGNADVKAALKEANGRVLAVARVHRSLYTSLDVRWVSLAEYLSSLIRDLENVSSGSGDHQNSISLVCDQISNGAGRSSRNWNCGHRTCPPTR